VTQSLATSENHLERTGSAVDRCSAEIRHLLAAKSYRSGDRLPPERELAEIVGVSRPVVREAIRRLAADGLLIARRGAGTFVADIELADVFDVRLRLEPLAAELAAARRSADQAQRLRSLAREMKTLIGRPEEFSACDADIHRLIAEASGNALLRKLLRSLGQQVTLSRSLTSQSRTVRITTLRDISETVDAIAAKNAQKAASAMERHIANIEASITRSDGASTAAPPLERLR
jgi:GntR family transcriptional repressor for pyruvate dehydrogenase complex